MEEIKTVFKGKTKTGRDLIIRYLQPNDTLAILDFIHKISQEKTFVYIQGEQISLKEEKKYIKLQIKNISINKTVHLLAFIGDNLVGSSDIELKNFVESHVGSFGIIIAQKYRGEGIGEILTKTVIKEAKKNVKGLKIIILDVFSNNPVAQKLYKSIGFIEYGLLPRGVKHRGKFIDEILMFKNV